jgi:hypothetical protein
MLLPPVFDFFISCFSTSLTVVGLAGPAAAACSAETERRRSC